MLEKNDVPLLIFSAGLGDVIETFLRTKIFGRTGKIPSNIHIISNRMRFQNNRLVGFEDEIIHSCNKGLTPMRELQAKGVFKTRTTALLLGDSVGDVHMADWLIKSGHVHDVLKVGFLNRDVPKARKEIDEARFPITLVL